MTLHSNEAVAAPPLTAVESRPRASDKHLKKMATEITPNHNNNNNNNTMNFDNNNNNSAPQTTSSDISNINIDDADENTTSSNIANDATPPFKSKRKSHSNTNVCFVEDEVGEEFTRREPRKRASSLRPPTPFRRCSLSSYSAIGDGEGEGVGEEEEATATAESSTFPPRPTELFCRDLFAVVGGVDNNSGSYNSNDHHHHSHIHSRSHSLHHLHQHNINNAKDRLSPLRSTASGGVSSGEYILASFAHSPLKMCPMQDVHSYASVGSPTFCSIRQPVGVGGDDGVADEEGNDAQMAYLMSGRRRQVYRAQSESL